jgi:hypothetical protein
MSTQSVTSLVCPVIVGRTHELDALERHVDGGGPPAIVVSGEAGIGINKRLNKQSADLSLRALSCRPGHGPQFQWLPASSWPLGKQGK